MKKINLYNRTIIFSSFLTSFTLKLNVIGKANGGNMKLDDRMLTEKHEIRYCWQMLMEVT
jgi:hypothetical protein